MIKYLDGNFETVDYSKNKSMRLYDNVENEEYPVHWHNAIEIIMAIENDYTVICGDTTYVLNEQDLLIIPPGELHNLKANPGRRLILQIDNGAIKDNPALSSITPLFMAPVLVNSEYDKEFKSFINKYIMDIYELNLHHDRMSEIYIYIKLLNIFTRVMDYRINEVRYDDENNNAQKYSDKFLLILKYIDKNYMYDISLEKLADIAGYSKYHFSRIFKKYSNTTFINYINNKRLKSAELLLLEDNLSITDIAMQSGFSSLTTFNRVFKELKGCTPSDFKKLYKK